MLIFQVQVNCLYESYKEWVILWYEEVIMIKNNEIFLNNIDCLRQEHGYTKMGEFETNVLGLSTGYFSRLRNIPDSLPSADLLLKLSDIFNVSIDILLSADIREIGKNNKLILRFLEELIRDTIDEKIVWERENYPFKNRKIPIDRKNEVTYDTIPNGDKLLTEYAHKVICIIPVLFEGIYEEKPFQIQGYQMVFRNPKEINKRNLHNNICFSDTVIEPIRKKIYELVHCIERKSTDMPLSDLVIQEITELLDNKHM